MLPLTGRIAGYLISPAISELDIVSLGRHHKNRFNGEGHSGSHFFLGGLRVCKMVHHWRHVQFVGNSVASKVFVDEVAMGVSVFLDDHPNFVVFHSWFAAFNRHIHCFSGYLRQPFDLIRNFDLLSFDHYHR